MDYKHRVPGNKRSKRTVNLLPKPSWLWPLAGVALLVVVFVSFAVLKKEDHEPQPSEQEPHRTSTALEMPSIAPRPLATPLPSKNPKSVEAKEAREDGVKAAKGAAQLLDARDAVNETVSSTPTPKPTIRFTFYKILPEKEVIIQESEVKSIKHDEKLGNFLKAEQYLIQVGSYDTLAEAEKIKAQLSGLKVKSKVETMRVENSEWHRVKIGPFDNLNDADKVRDYLRDHQIATVIQKSTTK